MYNGDYKLYSSSSSGVAAVEGEFWTYFEKRTFKPYWWAGCRLRRKEKSQRSGFWPEQLGGPFTKMKEEEAETGFGGDFKSSIPNMLNLKCLLDFQKEMLARQTDMSLEYMGEIKAKK